MKTHFERELDAVTKRAAEYALAHCGAREGEMLTEEHMRKVSQLAIEQLMPFIMHNLRRRRRP
jgi:hypothetical protein